MKNRIMRKYEYIIEILRLTIQIRFQKFYFCITDEFHVTDKSKELLSKNIGSIEIEETTSMVTQL